MSMNLNTGIDTDSDWKRVANEQPYWGVLSLEEFKGHSLSPEAERRFFETGEVLMGNLFGFIQRHLASDFSPRASLDFGCGVGRLLLPMAKRSEQALGLDVSPTMLDLARHHASRNKIRNVQLAESDDDLSAINGKKFDFVNSIIVLQHIPPERGYGIIRRLLEVLNTGGIASIQLTYAKARKFFPHEQPKAEYFRRDGNQILDLIPVREQPRALITMFDYDLNSIFALTSRFAGHPMMILPTEDDSHLGVHLLFSKARDP